MDALTDRRPAREAAAPSPPPALPPEAPLVMPAQDLGRAPARPDRGRPARGAGLRARRGLVLAATLALSGLGTYEMYKVLDVGGLTGLEIIVLALFVALFAWIAFSFANSLAGVLAMLRAGPPLGLGQEEPPLAPCVRTAILLPTYNEPPARVFAGLQATLDSLKATGHGGLFDVFILSDSTDPDIWVAEEAEFLALRRRAGAGPGLFYRHRAENIDRKAGNIAEWVTRFGGAYEAMLILDADSVMSGPCIVRLAAALERHPEVGLIQTLPVIVGGLTLFARLQQFAGRLYGPLIAHGLAFWHGPQSNYWGHNAIIRTRAFAQSAGLPHLRGPKPFGGHVLSHDFAEAALLVRAGWAVHLAPQLIGSYEEGPPSLAELAVRDRRWCQGNLQHAAILPARGLSWLSRVHMLTGIGSYVCAPLWLLMLLAGLLTALQARFIPPDYFPTQFALFPTWPAQDPVRAAWVFAGTLAVLLLPKLFAFALMLADPAERRGFGGGAKAFCGMLAEIFISGLCAPVTMVSQTLAVAGILAGRDGGWQPQQRDDGSIGWRAAVASYAPQTLLGLLFAGATFAISLPLMLWMSPVIIGLLAATPLAVWTSRAGSLFGLLSTPEERAPPAVLRRAQELRGQARDPAQESEARDPAQDRKARHPARESEARDPAQDCEGQDAPPPAEAVARLAGDRDLLAFHCANLPHGGRRARGDFRPDRLVARAKIKDAPTRAHALALLDAREKRAALGDAWALRQLMAREP